jgi:hypothetical protein
VKYTPELYSLALISTATALMWVPYVLARMTTNGVLRAIGTPGPGYLTDAPWADRARRAHLNAIENLAVFAPLVLVGAIIEVSTQSYRAVRKDICRRTPRPLHHLRRWHSRRPNPGVSRGCMCNARHRDSDASKRAVNRNLRPPTR